MDGALCRPPNTGQRQNVARFLIGPVVHVNIVANKSVKVEQAHGDVGMGLLSLYTSVVI